MVKKIAIACLCMALGSSLNARDMSQNKTFIGLEFESTKIDSSSEIYFNDAFQGDFGTKSDSVMEYGLNIGAEGEEWRTTFLYTYYNDDMAEAEEIMHKGSLLLDYFIWTTNTGDYEIKPYIGGHVGYMAYELKADVGYGIDQKIVDESDIFYGGQIGVAMTISEIIGLDLSYKYSLTNLNDIPLDFLDLSGNRVHLNNSLDSMGSIAFSIKYFY